MLADRSLSCKKCKFFWIILKNTPLAPFVWRRTHTWATLGEPTFPTFPYLAICSHEHEEQKRVGSAIRVTHLAKPTFFGCIGSTFLHINTLGSTRSTGSRRDNQSMRERRFQLLACAKRSTFLAKVDSAGRVTLFPGRDNFARYKRVLEKFGLLSSVVVLRNLNKQRGYWTSPKNERIVWVPLKLPKRSDFYNFTLSYNSPSSSSSSCLCLKMNM